MLVKTIFFSKNKAAFTKIDFCYFLKYSYKLTLGKKKKRKQHTQPFMKVKWISVSKQFALELKKEKKLSVKPKLTFQRFWTNGLI